jgi:hypothetical protein
VDKEEIAAIYKDFLDRSQVKDPLHRELLDDLARTAASGDMDSVLKQVQRSSMEQAKIVLKENLSSQEYQRFIASLILSGIRVAQSSGGGVFHKDRISKQEQALLASLASSFDLDLSSLADAVLGKVPEAPPPRPIPPIATPPSPPVSGPFATLEMTQPLQPAQGKRPSPGMKFCMECRAEIPRKAKFCSECGANQQGD